MRNGRFRVMLAHHRGPYKQSLALAMVILLALFLFFPPFEFTPYELQAEEEPIDVVQVEEFVIPPPPTEPTKPPVEIDPVDGDEDTEDIPETAPDDWDDYVAPPPGPATRPAYIVFDEQPEPEYIAQPVYPRLAREAGIEGTVLLRVRVGLDHRIHEAIVLSSDVTPAMERAAIDAALQCRYTPAKQQGVPVEVWVAIRIDFRLN